MNLRNAHNHLRLHQAALGALAVALLLLTAMCLLAFVDWWIALIPLALAAALISWRWTAFVQCFHEARGAQAFQQKRLADAEAWFRKSLQAAQRMASDDPCRGRIYLWLTEVARKQGHFDDAETFGHEWLAAEETSWGNDHPRTAVALETLAAVYEQIARYHQARPLLERALAIREHSQDPVELSRCLGRLGYLWGCQERYETAAPYLRRALDIINTRLSLPHPDALVLICQLSTIWAHTDRLEEAETLAESALERAEHEPAPLRMPIAYAMNQLAYVRRYQERFDEAEDLLRRSMAIVQEAAPDNAMVLHGHLHLLGVILRHQSHWAEAEDCFREALRLREEYCAPEDLAVARVLEDYAELLELMNRMDEAHAMEHRAKQIRDFHSPFRIV